MSNPIQVVADAVRWVQAAAHNISNAVSHPLANLQHLGQWIVAHGEIFAVAGIVGILLWLFGLHVGKRIVQWSLALYALVAILSGAL